MARCDGCVRRRDGGTGSCPLPADLEAARRARGEHDCAAFRPIEVIASARKAGKKDAPQEGLF